MAKAPATGDQRSEPISAAKDRHKSSYKSSKKSDCVYKSSEKSDSSSFCETSTKHDEQAPAIARRANVVLVANSDVRRTDKQLKLRTVANRYRKWSELCHKRGQTPHLLKELHDNYIGLSNERSNLTYAREHGHSKSSQDWFEKECKRLEKEHHEIHGRLTTWLQVQRDLESFSSPDASSELSDDQGRDSKRKKLN